ncbi:Divalent-cation tolerance protein CutA [Polystyrenella longa]|uniref:Divalent-cation tolerance protein CutA n=1 Tax=Polystyrenella longa TaxID=2528007 RepID=A0A518CPG1_9PLAN|nr:divalent-cation tolerance protein CutA [Polystyrenella longa]QDU81111.1 Divalent-cation tolerance protein CutA [Polystyrenella longa]
MSAAVVYVTMPSSEQAESLAQIVVTERLAACANIVPQIKSVYRWEEEVQTADECLVYFKTSQDRVQGLIARVQELHEYEVPCITSWPITKILPEYFSWIQDSTSSP